MAEEYESCHERILAHAHIPLGRTIRIDLADAARGGSIPSNIAEGHARHTTKEYVLFVSHAEGSTAELQTQLRIAIDLGYCVPEVASVVFDQIAEIRKMLNALRRELNARIART